MGVSRFGNWGAVRQKMRGNLAVELAARLRRANEKNAMLLVREIQRGIKKQAPGGKKFAALAESTIDRKGSSKALIDTGFLLNSITHKLTDDAVFVGLLRTAKGKDGEAMVNIGAVMEYGATIKHPSGATIIIPARPFLHPVMEKYRGEVMENYREAIRSAMSW